MVMPWPREPLCHRRCSPRRTRRLRNLERAERIGEFCGHPETRTFGELLIDLEEEDKGARGVVFGLLVEMERN
jgi:hypothetical protein